LRVYKHLRRLESVWIEPPLYFLTICVAGRRPILANDQAFDILRGEFGAARERYGWTVGRSVVMPDHLHFFCMSDDLPDSSSLSRFIGGFKQWSAKRIVHAKGVSPPLWQEQFFDRLLRSDESYESKWLYVRDNPVRAGLVDAAEDWPYGGEIATIAR